MLELLAPAGNADSAHAAVQNGANAVYLGYSSFSARQSAENFDGESMCAVIDKAHILDVKVYVAMNTVVKTSETEAFLRTLLSVWEAGADAIILQDLLLGKYVHERYPSVELHLSTQAGVCNVNGAKLAKAYGFSRVILARETPLEEIKRITPIIETEAFVQGALCTCFSGQCYFSSFAGGNSGNRGRCKQPCRKLYAYDRIGFEEKSYALSLSDLSVGQDIRKYIDAGVTSFKIEGRMRRAEYVAAAVRYYRLILDGNSGEEQALSDLKRTYNRGNYTKGLAFGQDKRLLSPAVQGHLGEKIGVVKVVNGSFFVESAFAPRNGDGFKILREGREVGGAFFLKTEKRGFSISSKTRLKNGDGVFVTTDTAVNERVLSGTRKRRVSLRLKFVEGERATAEADGVRYCSDEPLQTAQKSVLTKEELIACFRKTDDLPVEVSFAEVVVDGDIFIPKSKLNAMRREFYAALVEKWTKRERGTYAYRPIAMPSFSGVNRKIAVLGTNFDGVRADIAIYKPNDFNNGIPQSFRNGSFEKYLYYPPFCIAEDERALDSLAESGIFDGVYVENYAGILYAQARNLKIFVGTGLHLMNAVSVAEANKLPNVAYYALSKEANAEEMRGLLSDKAFVLSSGDIKVMDLCYCPFGKSCAKCDKKSVYRLTDENGRVFPVRRYNAASGACRFEVYNCASLVGTGITGAGKIIDISVQPDGAAAVNAANDESLQKNVYSTYTSGHFKRGVL